MPEHHELMGGKLHVYKRESSRLWQCSTYLNGRNHRTSTKEESLALAKEFAEDWYLGLRGKHRAGELNNGKTFAEAAKQFEREYGVITQGQRNAQYVAGHWRRLNLHLLPFFGKMTVQEVTPGKVQEYRVHRMQPPANQPAADADFKPPARSTLHQEIVVIRQVLQTAQRHAWLAFVPDLTPPYKTSGKVSHRAWFSHDEYRQLYEATRERARNPRKQRWRHASEELHDFVLFMANTGLRPDEAKRLQNRDITIIEDEQTGETILEIEVRGKRGIGYCKSMPGAVRPLERIRNRRKLEPADPLFPSDQRELFNTILDEQELKVDRDGNPRTAYSLRHTYICFRLMEGADIYQLAKNCRTSVEMIEKHYAVHLKNTLDARAINTRRSGVVPVKSKELPKPERSQPRFR